MFPDRTYEGSDEAQSFGGGKGKADGAFRELATRPEYRVKREHIPARDPIEIGGGRECLHSRPCPCGETKG